MTEKSEEEEKQAKQFQEALSKISTPKVIVELRIQQLDGQGELKLSKKGDLSLAGMKKLIAGTAQQMEIWEHQTPAPVEEIEDVPKVEGEPEKEKE